MQQTWNRKQKEKAPNKNSMEQIKRKVLLWKSCTWIYFRFCCWFFHFNAFKRACVCGCAKSKTVKREFVNKTFCIKNWFWSSSPLFSRKILHWIECLHLPQRWWWLSAVFGAFCCWKTRGKKLRLKQRMRYCFQKISCSISMLLSFIFCFPFSLFFCYFLQWPACLPACVLTCFYVACNCQLNILTFYAVLPCCKPVTYHSLKMFLSFTIETATAAPFKVQQEETKLLCNFFRFSFLSSTWF